MVKPKEFHKAELYTAEGKRNTEPFGRARYERETRGTALRDCDPRDTQKDPPLVNRSLYASSSQPANVDHKS